jgi:hypothetical protein
MENETSVQWKAIIEFGGHMCWWETAGLQPQKTPKTPKSKI